MAAKLEAKVEVVKTGLTPRALTLGILLLIVFTTWYALGASTIIWEHTNAYIHPLLIFFPFLIIVSLVQNKVKFTGAELSLIYTLLFWSYFGVSLTWRDIALAFMFSQRYGWVGGGIRGAVPWTKDVLPAHWGNEWFMVLGAILFAYMGIFYCYIWRRHVIEVERLPFPISQIPITLIESTVGRTEGRAGLFGNRMFWYGFLIAWLYLIPAWTTTLAMLLKIPVPIKTGTGTGIDEAKTTFYIVGNPPPHGTPGWSRLGMGGGMSYELNLIPVLHTVLPNASAVLTFNLGALALGFMLPMDVAISSTIAWLLFYWIIPPIQVAMGLFPKEIMAGSFWYWIQFKYWYSAGVKNGLQASTWLTLGAPFALFIAPLIHHRRYFFDTIRAAMRGSKSGSAGWEDPYRLYWIGFIIVFILNIAWNIVFGVTVLASLMFTIFFLIMMGGFMRVGAEGWSVQNWTFDPIGPAAMVLTSGTTPAKDAPTTAAANLWTLWEVPWNANQGDPGGFFGDGIGVMRIGQQVKGMLKDHLIATFLGIIISTVVTVIVVNWYNSMFAFRFGYTGFSVPPETIDIGTQITSHWTILLAGTVLWTIVYFLRVRFPWFIINPVGFIITTPCQITGQVALSITIAWILKRIAVRVGGARMVERLQWLFVGCVVGLSMNQLFYELSRIYQNWGNPTCLCGY
jgi:hypothetical protein